MTKTIGPDKKLIAVYEIMEDPDGRRRFGRIETIRSFELKLMSKDDFASGKKFFKSEFETMSKNDAKLAADKINKLNQNSSSEIKPSTISPTTVNLLETKETDKSITFVTSSKLVISKDELKEDLPFVEAVTYLTHKGKFFIFCITSHHKDSTDIPWIKETSEKWINSFYNIN